jgi:hypothetical protein
MAENKENEECGLLEWDPGPSETVTLTESRLIRGKYAYMWSILFGNMEAFDQILSHCFVFCSPGVTMLLIIDVVALKI